MLSLVYLADGSLGGLDPLCHDLRQSGNTIVEASSVHEALWLCSQHHISTIIISAGFDDHQLHELSQRYVTVKLKFDASSRDVLGELAAAS